MDEFGVNVTMPDAPLPILLPDGWTVVYSGDLLTVMGPESDLQLSFLARPVVVDIADLICRLWREVKPGFDISILQKVEMPAKNGWDREIHIGGFKCQVQRR